MSEWVTLAVAEFAEVISGATPATNRTEYWDGNIEWVTPVDLSKIKTRFLFQSIRKISQHGLGASSVQLIPKMNIVMSSRAPIGYFAISVNDFTTNQGCKSFKLKPGHDPDYHYYNFVFHADYFKKFGSGSTFLEISKADIEKLSFRVNVSLPEQRKIARILTTVDEVIGRTEAAIGKYKAIKRGMMHDLFTRGLDHNGKLRPRREEAPELYHQTALGWLPKEWEVLALHEVVQVRTGIALNSKRKFIDPITAHYLRVANVQDGYLDLSEMKTIQVERSDLERYRVHPGDVLMNEGGDLDKLGRGCLWGGQYAPCVHQNHVFVVRCNAAVLPAFLNKWTETSTARRYFMVAGKQTTNLASINKTQLGGLPIVTPPVSEQTRMVRFMNTFEKREKTEVRQLEKGKLIKQALMQDLLTGRKAVVL
jgi:type I restriction enzyme S subunit